jgi:hypothetical protein
MKYKAPNKALKLTGNARLSGKTVIMRIFSKAAGIAIAIKKIQK